MRRVFKHLTRFSGQIQYLALFRLHPLHIAFQGGPLLRIVGRLKEQEREQFFLIVIIGINSFLQGFPKLIPEFQIFFCLLLLNVSQRVQHLSRKPFSNLCYVAILLESLARNVERQVFCLRCA
jgi:hypothetical protein